MEMVKVKAVRGWVGNNFTIPDGAILDMPRSSADEYIKRKMVVILDEEKPKKRGRPRKFDKQAPEAGKTVTVV